MEDNANWKRDQLSVIASRLTPFEVQTDVLAFRYEVTGEVWGFWQHAGGCITLPRRPQIADPRLR